MLFSKINFTEFKGGEMKGGAVFGRLLLKGKNLLKMFEK